MMIDQLLEKIKTKRDSGEVHLAIIEKNDNKPWQDTLVEFTRANFSFSWNAVLAYRRNKKTIEEEPISAGEVAYVLIELKSKELATSILTQLLQEDMAHGGACMAHEEASEFATSFVSLFGKEVKCFTNASWHWSKDETGKGRFELGGWNGLTEATFDSGILLVDDKKIGIAWVVDED